MTVRSTSIGVSLDRAYHHWRERGALLQLPTSAEAAPVMTIAISRERGAGGSDIASALAKRLEWPLYDNQLVDLIATDTGISERLLGQLDERCPNWFTEIVQSLGSERTISGVGFALRLRKILLALYCHGDCVVLGRGAAQVLPAQRTLRVRLIAPIEHRIRVVAGRQKIAAEAAAEEVSTADQTRTQFVRNYFGHDLNDGRLYDLTMDTSRFSVETIVEPILAALAARQKLLESELRTPRHA